MNTPRGITWMDKPISMCMYGGCNGLAVQPRFWLALFPIEVKFANRTEPRHWWFMWNPFFVVKLKFWLHEIPESVKTNSVEYAIVWLDTHSMEGGVLSLGEGGKRHDPTAQHIEECSGSRSMNNYAMEDVTL